MRSAVRLRPARERRVKRLVLVLRALKDPKIIIGGVLLGFASRFYLRDFSHRLEPLADIDVSLPSMCLLPVPGVSVRTADVPVPPMRRTSERARTYLTVIQVQ